MTPLNLLERKFENHVIFSKPFVKLGKKYFDNGQVINLTQSSSNNWHAKVKGIEDYSVNVELKKHEYSDTLEILNSTCNCSFIGPHCIHKVAVYYAVYNALFPNEISENSFSEISLSELKDDITVQNVAWELHKAYLALNDNGSKEDISNAFRSTQKSFTLAKNTAKKNPALAIRLLLVSHFELMEIKNFSSEERWYNWYYNSTKAKDTVISEIRDKQIAIHVTELLLDETLELLRDPRNSFPQYLNFSEEYRKLHFEILIELSSLAQSYKQIEQLLNELGLILPNEKDFFMNQLLMKQGKPIS